jgi:hypothetical protein
MGFLAQVERASDISFDALQRFYLSLYTGQQDYPPWIEKTAVSNQWGCIHYATIAPSLDQIEDKLCRSQFRLPPHRLLSN